MIIITGAASGMGEATAELLAKKGYDVALIDLSKQKLTNLKQRLGSSITAIEKVLDVSNAAETNSIFDYLFKNFSIEGLIHCAGIISSQEEEFLSDTNNEESLRIIQTNIIGTLNTNRAFIRNAVNNSRKYSIVNIASISATFNSADFPSYSLSKGAIISLTKSLALSYGSKGIRVNCISPGVVKTPMSYIETPNFDDYIDELNQLHPLGRIGTPLDVAKLLKFLISEESEWITGQNFVIDGGYTLSK
jgi:NAD(P)-dependent dehydrogenase (short-subunit alcohol dehydrogenase family)